MSEQLPRIENRAERQYLGIPVSTSMAEEAQVIGEHLAELQAWMRNHEIEPTGGLFVRYRQIEMPHRLEIEVCLPVQEAPPGDGRVRGNALPEGRYAVLLHTGPFDQLVDANERLQRWAAQEGIEFQTKQRGETTEWTSRVETYLTDPQRELDPEKHQTEIAYLLRV